MSRVLMRSDPDVPRAGGWSHWEMGYKELLQALIRQSGPGMQIPGCGC